MRIAALIALKTKIGQKIKNFYNLVSWTSLETFKPKVNMKRAPLRMADQTTMDI